MFIMYVFNVPLSVNELILSFLSFIKCKYIIKYTKYPCLHQLPHQLNQNLFAT